MESKIADGVSYSVSKMSFARRMELDEARARFGAAGWSSWWPAEDAGGKMDAALLEVEIERLYVKWGLREVTGLEVDGSSATPNRWRNRVRKTCSARPWRRCARPPGYRAERKN